MRISDWSSDVCSSDLSPWIAEHQRDSVLVHRRSRVVGRLMLAASYEHNIKATAGEEQAHESGKGRRIKRDQRRSDPTVADRRSPPQGTQKRVVQMSDPEPEHSPPPASRINRDARKAAQTGGKKGVR